MGYTNTILKSDNEPALMALKRAVKDMSTVEVINEETPLEIQKPTETSRMRYQGWRAV